MPNPNLRDVRPDIIAARSQVMEKNVWRELGNLSRV